MRKIVDVKIIKPFILRCTFDNGEVRDLLLEKHIEMSNKYSHKLFEKSIFETVRIGENGELFWKDIGEIQELDGTMMKCDFDICPDFAYLNSEPVFVDNISISQ